MTDKETFTQEEAVALAIKTGCMSKPNWAAAPVIHKNKINDFANACAKIAREKEREEADKSFETLIATIRARSELK
jgi:hypothetical protein